MEDGFIVQKIPLIMPTYLSVRRENLSIGIIKC